VIRILKLTAAAGVGLLLYFYALSFALHTGWAVSVKLRGNADACPWYRIARFQPDLNRFDALYNKATGSIDLVKSEPDLRQVSSPRGLFWIRNDELPAGSIGYLFAEHDWLAETNETELPQEGDVVIDVGAHVGVFAAKALKRGAAKVIVVEPDPLNVECLRRNFTKEIDSGRVAIVSDAAWNKTETLTFHLGKSSAWNSLRGGESEESIDVRARPLDDIVNELGLDRVDYIKVDVEGVEAEVLEGAVETMRRFRPTLMVDTHHGSDGWERAPQILRTAHEDYEAVCGPCQVSEVDGSRVVPHVMFYR